MIRARAFLLLLIAGVACGEERRGGGGSAKKGPTKTVESVSVVLDKGSIGAGERANATVTGVFAGGGTTDLTASATWASTDPAIATVAAGVITGVAPGQATISVTASGKSAMTTILVTLPGATVVGLALDPGQDMIEVGATQTLIARQLFSTGDRIDASARTSFVSSAPTIVSVAGFVATAASPGMATITATLDGHTAQRTFTVRAPISVTAVEVTTPRTSLGPTESAQLVATAVKSDGTREPVTAQATWRSSNASIVSVDGAGRATGVAAGSATLFASFGGREGSTPISVVVCQYPSAGSSLGNTGTLPNMSWTGAFDGTGNTINFSTSSFFCDPSYAQYSSIHFIVGAGWCPNCPEYTANVGAIANQIAAAGGFLVFVEIEDSSYDPATHTDANQIVNRSVTSGAGIRIGDGETMPSAMIFGAAVSSVPNAFVVRRSDMQVIASQSTSQYVLDFVDLAQQAAGGTITPPPGACGPADEEASEPNDSEAQAATVTLGNTVSGGLCVAQTRDFYRITHTAGWRLDLTFNHSVGDLDVYVYDSATQGPLQDASGNPIGSEGTVSNESFTHSGASTIMVVGYQGATAPYQLLVTAN